MRRIYSEQTVLGYAQMVLKNCLAFKAYDTKVPHGIWDIKAVGLKEIRPALNIVLTYIQLLFFIFSI